MSYIDENKQKFEKLSKQIWENPELGHQEFKASKWIADELEIGGFHVEKGIAGLPTAFRGIYDSNKPGPTIAYLCEYDALPIGHACGHNLIGIMSLAAGLALTGIVDEKGGKIVVIGTPAEETSGGKVTIAEQGYFNDVDVAMMVHPSQYHLKSGTSLALEALQFDFFGKSAHAASNPDKGINALDAAILTFNNINALRQQIPSDARIHGIISKGGEAPNLIPNHTQTRFYVRRETTETLIELVNKVKNCANAAALATGCTLEISNYELGFDNLITNQALSNIYTKNLQLFGVSESEIREKRGGGSTDLGNVSHKVPAIHPYVKVPDSPYLPHTEEFRDAVGSDAGMQTLSLGAKVLAYTGFDIYNDPKLLNEIKEEFRTNVKGS